MKQFYCDCGSPVFFDSDRCVACGSRLGFDPCLMTMRTITEVDDGLWQSRDQRLFRLCSNTVDFGVCNWLVDAADTHALCFACRFNRTVPNQSLPGNQQRWARLEEGKKRLFYTLMQLELPLESGWDSPDRGLLLDFVQDERGDAEAFAETFVHTGYMGGVITINTLEADDAAREAQRLQMNETYRTVLGHLRHESGHYYWQLLAPDTELLDSIAEQLGDPHTDYEAALQRYYEQGPPTDWSQEYISAYATAHPLEDWAESWGHYLHIYDALETAAAHNLIVRGPEQMTIAERVEAWSRLSVTLNELNRSVGRRDAYPFALNARVGRKLALVDAAIRRLRTRPPVKAAG